MEDSVNQAAVETAQPALPPARKLRVLVVDDSRMQRRVLTSSLTRWGYIVAEAASGQAALDLCAEFDPDMVLSDWMMLGMDGLEFCRAFRRMPRDRYGYFVLLTSRSEKEAVTQGLDCGADDFLTKPVNPAELRARLLAGERILQMQDALTQKNAQIAANLEEMRGLYEALDSDLREARELQHSLLNDTDRQFDSARLSLMLRTSGHVGGDLVGQFPIDDERIGLFALDVSGHGVSSALMTARLAGFLSSTVPEQNVALRALPDGRFDMDAPEAVVKRLNDLVLREMETQHFFTMVLGEFHLKTGRLTLVQAGHPHPLLLRADGRIEVLGRGGLPVGLLEQASFEQRDYQLEPGDRLLVYSDGFTECLDPAGQMLDTDGLCRMLRESAPTVGPAMLDRLTAQLMHFARRDSFDDDLSALLLAFDP